MARPQAVHVSLTGDRSGDYLVVEERPDGSLLLAPAPVAFPDRKVIRSANRWRGGRQRADREALTVPELLMGWGVELADGEFVVEFLAGEIDRRNGFLALTRDRLIFVSQGGQGPAAVLAHPRSSVRNAWIVGARVSRKLSIALQDGEIVIEAADAASLRRLRDRLVGS